MGYGDGVGPFREAQAYGKNDMRGPSRYAPTAYFTRNDFSLRDALARVYGSDTQRVIEEAANRQAKFGPAIQGDTLNYRQDFVPRSREGDPNIYAIPDYSKGVGEPIPTYFLSHFASGPRQRVMDDYGKFNNQYEWLGENEPKQLISSSGVLGDGIGYNVRGAYYERDAIRGVQKPVVFPSDLRVPVPRVQMNMPIDTKKREVLPTLVHEMTHANQDGLRESIPYSGAIESALELSDTELTKKQQNYLIGRSEFPAHLAGAKASFKLDTGETLGSNFSEESLQRFIDYLTDSPRAFLNTIGELLQSEQVISPEESGMHGFSVGDMAQELLRQVASVDSDTAVG